MVSQMCPTNELYNLRWNSYFSNLINVFTDHQNQETLVDVTLGCEGQFIKAHKLVLSACSAYFQKIFQNHTAPQLLILLNDVKFENLRLVVQFMYKGEVKVADSEMPHFLQLGKMLQVKGLCSVELQEKKTVPAEKPVVEKKQPIMEKKQPVIEKKQPVIEKKQPVIEKKQPNTEKQPSVEKFQPHTEKRQPNTEKQTKPPDQTAKPDKSTNLKTKTPTSKPSISLKAVEKKDEAKEPSPVIKKRKLSPVPVEPKKKIVSTPPPVDIKDVSHIPRPPNAFMIFANQWRKKLAVEYPNESNKDISVRLGNMWKSLSHETRDAFYEDARKADEEHKQKYPGYYYSPKEARHRKAIATISKTVQKVDSPESASSVGYPEFIEIKCEDDVDVGEYSTPTNNGS